MFDEAIANRFWAKVRKGDGCWPWTHAKYTGGYGKFAIEHRRLEGAHRMAWMLTFGPIPDGLHVCHACDNRACCNPKHLFVGTSAANNIDARQKGRVVPQNGALTANQVASIKAATAAGEPMKAIARRLGVHRNTVRGIVRGKVYIPAA